MNFALGLVPWWMRALAVLALAATLFGTGLLKGLSIGRDNLDRYQAKQTQALLDATLAAAAKTQELQRKKDEADRAANIREKTLRRDADRVLAERNGLRDDLAASRSSLAGASCDSLRQRAATLTDVFEQCTERYTGMAKKADGHASDSLKFQEAWPQVVK